MPSSIYRMLRERGRLAIAALALGLMLMGSCLGEPEIDERWTKIEFLDVSPAPAEPVTGAQSINVSVSGRITYRQILTGFLVAEARYASSLPQTTVVMDPNQHTAEIASYVDYILANSVTAGRDTRAVTGWDHLMQDIDFTFTAQVPPDTTSGGLFLLLYMGSGDEIELPNGQDSLVVTPFVSSNYEVLHTGFPVTIVP